MCGEELQLLRPGKPEETTAVRWRRRASYDSVPSTRTDGNCKTVSIFVSILDYPEDRRLACLARSGDLFPQEGCCSLVASSANSGQAGSLSYGKSKTQNRTAN